MVVGLQEPPPGDVGGAAVRTVTTFYPEWRSHLAVNRARDGWCLQWAYRTRCGTRFDPPIERGFKTKREAEDRKRAIRDGVK